MTLEEITARLTPILLMLRADNNKEAYRVLWDFISELEELIEP